MPIFAKPKVAPDRYWEVDKALYSIPGERIGQHLHARADSQLVRYYHRRQLIKTRPGKPPGGPCTHAGDLPDRTSDYALRDVGSPKVKAAAAEASVGICAQRILDVPLPWMSMRAVYRRSAWPAMERPRSTPPAHGHWSMTSSTSRRSPGCSSKPSRR